MATATKAVPICGPYSVRHTDKQTCVVGRHDAVGHPTICELPRWDTQRPETIAETKATADLLAASWDLLEACKAQHEALDVLMAMLVQRDADFKPTKCPAWPAVLAGFAAISKASGE